MIRWANRILFTLNAILLVFAAFYLGHHRLGFGDGEIEYKDLITIILTAVAVLLAAVTIFVALMAIWGYNSLRDEATRVAVKTAANVARVVAARESVTMSGVVTRDGEADDIDELAVALRDADGPTAKPK